jgi:predicted PurR-regulated permease PerM
MNIIPQTRFWLIILAVFAMLVWLLQPVLLPFVAGMTIAYFLNPVVDTLTRSKLPRWLGSLLVLLGFVLIAVLVAALVLPLLQSQTSALINAAPEYVKQLNDHLRPWLENWVARFAPEDIDQIRDAAGQSVGEAAKWFGTVLQHVVSGGFALFDILALTIVTPVVAFYMLRDWPKLTKTIDGILPRNHYNVIREQLAEIDTTLSGFVRGQALVCLALGTIYTVGLSIVGLHYGAAIGVAAGILSFIPYVGTIFGWVSSVLLATAQFGDWRHVSAVIAVFVIGHALEAYVLTPRLVGHRVGLHPVWILFALIAGVKLMGFTGVLIAVPSAAVIGVLVRFGIQLYKSSILYKK